MSVRLVRTVLVVGLIAGCASPQPGPMPETAQSPTPGRPPPPAQSLTEILAETDDLTMFASLVSAANLTAALDEDAPFTVFAPSNDAVAALPVGTIEDLLTPERNNELVALLSHHIVPARLASSELRRGQALRTLGGTTLRVRTLNGQLTVDGASLGTTDVEARNGLLHITDRVLTP
ncbi:MAG: fasciclin domain-containing protein [Bacteroidota bacterium]